MMDAATMREEINLDPDLGDTYWQGPNAGTTLKTSRCLYSRIEERIWPCLLICRWFWERLVGLDKPSCKHWRRKERRYAPSIAVDAPACRLPSRLWRLI